MAGAYQRQVDAKAYFGHEKRETTEAIDAANRRALGAERRAARVRYGYVAAVDGGLTILLDGQDAPQAMNAVSTYKSPQLGDRVVVMRQEDDSYLVLGKQQTRVMLARASLWNYYDDLYTQPAAHKTPEGIVVLEGLVAKFSGSITKGTVIAVLPPGYRPDYDLLWSVNDTDGIGRVVVRANGNIEIYQITSGSYVSLGGIIFPAAGVANWNIIGTTPGYAWVSTWTNYTEAGYNFGPMRMWMSPNSGVVFVNGVATGGSTASLNQMFTYPASNQPDFYTIAQGTSANAYAGWRAQPTQNSVQFEVGSATGIGINGYWLTATSPAADAVRRQASYTGAGWVDYDTPTYGAVRSVRYQGVTYMGGLIKSGPSGTSSNRYIPRWYYPNGGNDDTATNGIIMRVQSATGVGRVDVTVQGFIVPRNGSASWFSLNGVAWMAA